MVCSSAAASSSGVMPEWRNVCRRSSQSPGDNRIGRALGHAHPTPHADARLDGRVRRSARRACSSRCRRSPPRARGRRARGAGAERVAVRAPAQSAGGRPGGADSARRHPDARPARARGDDAASARVRRQVAGLAAAPPRPFARGRQLALDERIPVPRPRTARPRRAPGRSAATAPDSAMAGGAAGPPGPRVSGRSSLRHARLITAGAGPVGDRETVRRLPTTRAGPSAGRAAAPLAPGVGRHRIQLVSSAGLWSGFCPRAHRADDPTRVRQPRHQADHDRNAKALRQVERLARHVVRLLRDDGSRHTIRANQRGRGCLLVLRAVHARVVGHHDDRPPPGSTRAELMNGSACHVEADVLHGHQRRRPTNETPSAAS